MEVPWRVAGASVQGTSHRESGTPCQDAHAYRVLPGGELVVCVADGAGSATRSDEGARWAVEEAVAALEPALREHVPADEAGWRAVATAAFQAAREALVERAGREESPLRAFATTLTCAVASDHALAVGQIGDGVVVAESLDGALFTAARPQRGEYANEAYFLTMADALDLLEVQVYPHPVRGLAITTDGLLRLALSLPAYEPYPPFFEPLLAFIGGAADPGRAEEDLERFLASERVCARTDDDKTLVLAARCIASENGATENAGEAPGQADEAEAT